MQAQCVQTPDSIRAQGNQIDAEVAAAQTLEDCDGVAIRYLQGEMLNIGMCRNFPSLKPEIGDLDPLDPKSFDPFADTAEEIRATFAAAFDAGMIAYFCYRDLERRGLIEAAPSAPDLLQRLRPSAP